MPASSISTLGAITSPWPASWRWAITTARRDCRGIGSRGSRPFGAKVSQPRRTADITRVPTWLTIERLVGGLGVADSDFPGPAGYAAADPHRVRRLDHRAG